MLSILLSLTTLLVSSQEDFDSMPVALRHALAQKPEKVRVVFEPGTYLVRDDHINLFGLDCPGTDLVFEGNGAILTGTAPTIKAGPFSRMDRLVEVVDKTSGLCRVRTRKRLDGEGQLYIQITSWYRTFTAPVTEIKGRYLYFTLEGLKKTGLAYNVNGDFTYGKQLPRFRLLRIREASGDVSTVVFHFTGCSFRSLTLSNLVVERNAGGRSEYAKDCAIRFYRNSFGRAKVQGCTFRSIQSHVLHIIYTDNVEIRECRFEDCQRIGLRSFNYSARTGVFDCIFVRMDRMRENSPCVQCQGTDYRVSGNRFVDYGNCAIRLGVHFTEDMEYPSSGIVENNEIYQTPEYNSAAPMNLLMDTGAIYVCTQNTSLTIRNNFIHDISGPYDNRGIFCDDGTVNTTITANQVLRIANSWCIDLRRDLSIESRSDSKIRKVNVGNQVKDNQVDGRIRFEQR